MNTTANTHAGFDAGNRRHVERRIKASKVHERQLAHALKWLMADSRGRLLMWERLGDSGVFRSSFAQSSELTAFREGRRDMGLRDLDQIMRLCPEQYMRMTAEARARNTARDASRMSRPTDTDGDRDDGREDADP